MRRDRPLRQRYFLGGFGALFADEGHAHVSLLQTDQYKFVGPTPRELRCLPGPSAVPRYFLERRARLPRSSGLRA